MGTYKTLYFLFIILFVPPFFYMAECDEIDNTLKKIEDVGKDIEDFSAGFIREKSMAILTRPIKISGKLYYKRSPRSLLWENMAPDKTLTLLTEKDIWVYYPELKQAQTWSLNEFAGKTQLVRSLSAFAGVTSGGSGLRKDYDITLSQEGEIIKLALKPKTEQLLPYIDKIELFLNSKTYFPFKFNYLSPDGDSETMTFSDFKVNTGLSSDIFRLNIPKDVEIIK